MTRAVRVKFSNPGITWQNAPMNVSTDQPADLRMCPRLTAEATLAADECELVHQALAVTAEHWNHCRNTAQAGRSAR
jgi:hypothetical protein